MNRFMFIASDFDILYKYCSEAEQLVQANPGECCHKARMAIEFIKNDLVGKLIDLTNGIKELLERHVIDEKLYNLLMEIRDFGNKGSHAAGVGIVSQADAQKTIDNLVMVCMWYALVQEKREYPLAYFDDTDLGKLKYVSPNFVVRDQLSTKIIVSDGKPVQVAATVVTKELESKNKILEKKSEADNGEAVTADASSPDYKELLKQAQQGDVLAHIRLARYFANMNNYMAVYQWCSRAAKLNCPEHPEYTYTAKMMMAKCLEEGKGVGKNPSKAIAMYKEITNIYKRPGSAIRIALLYEKGIGIEQNPTEAFNWWLKLAQDGLNNAMLKIAKFYYKGFGCTQDNVKALEWCKKAVNNGEESAISLLKKLEQSK